MTVSKTMIIYIFPCWKLCNFLFYISKYKNFKIHINLYFFNYLKTQLNEQINSSNFLSIPYTYHLTKHPQKHPLKKFQSFYLSTSLSSLVLFMLLLASTSNKHHKKVEKEEDFLLPFSSPFEIFLLFVSYLSCQRHFAHNIVCE